MKKKKLLTVLLLFLLTGGIILAQEKSSDLKLSLKEAQEYAIQNNKMMISSRMEVEASKVAVWEIISNALPQVTASGSFTDNLKLMTTLLPVTFLESPVRKYRLHLVHSLIQVQAFQASLLLVQCTFIYWY